MTASAPPRPLQGLRVMELSIAIAAPFCGRQLAHHGAEVFKIESPLQPDVARLFGSAWARDRLGEIGAAWFDTGPYVSEMSAGKKSVGLNLKHPGGLDAARRLLASCDIFITNYSTPAVRALGLGYEDVQAIRPDLIYVAFPGFGSDPASPYYDYIAWGPNQAPLVGLDNLTGYPDQQPAGVATIAPPDYCSSLHGLIAVLGALEHREQTGEGTYVDLSQFEATVALLGPFLLDNMLTGNVQNRSGNRLAGTAPNGVYPCRGTNRWVAITVNSDDEWAALVAVAGTADGLSDGLGDGGFASLAGREAAQDSLEEALANWTRQHSPEEIAAWLQAGGVAAYPVYDNENLLFDPQVRDREWFSVRPNSRFGRDLFASNAIHLTATPGDTATAGPILAEHTRDVLGTLAGLTAAEIDQLVADGAAHDPHAPDLQLSRPYDPYLYTLVAGVDTERKAAP